VRNLVKRIVREQFRKTRVALPPLVLVGRLHAPVNTATRAMINEDVAQLLGRLRAP
jgi:ribonuclease P protein component